MMPNRQFRTAMAAATLLLATPLPALAQGQEQHHAQSDAEAAAPAAPEPGTMAPGSMGPGMMQRMPQGSMSGGGMMPMMGSSDSGMGLMDCPMMSQMMQMHPGMMSQMMQMHPEMMSMMHRRMAPGGGMMGQGPGSGMMMGQGGGPGMMMRPGARGLDSGVVRPIQHLSTDDVRHYFEHRLEAMGNDRLKLGEVTQADDDTITVEIVTVEDSLVDRFEVDRHSGQIGRLQ